MYVDVKITTRHRIRFNGEEPTPEKVVEILKKGSHFDLWDHFDCTFDELIGVEEEMTPEKNGGYATIEVYEDNPEECFWKNGE